MSEHHERGCGDDHRRRIDPVMRDLATGNRNQPTQPERVLWSLLRKSQLDGMKFRRQVVLGRFIVDFCCPAEKLIVEVDGESHVGRGADDADRTAWLASQGYRVVRVTNDDVLHDLEAVGRAILLVAGRNVDAARWSHVHPPPRPLPQREGETISCDFDRVISNR